MLMHENQIRRRHSNFDLAGMFRKSVCSHINRNTCKKRAQAFERSRERCVQQCIDPRIQSSVLMQFIIRLTSPARDDPPLVPGRPWPGPKQCSCPKNSHLRRRETGRGLDIRPVAESAVEFAIVNNSVSDIFRYPGQLRQQPASRIV
jgi:hypothetical protein